MAKENKGRTDFYGRDFELEEQQQVTSLCQFIKNRSKLLSRSRDDHELQNTFDREVRRHSPIMPLAGVDRRWETKEYRLQLDTHVDEPLARNQCNAGMQQAT